jgi:pimeloyl-ACP methyl ester carboxylesterase
MDVRVIRFDGANNLELAGILYHNPYLKYQPAVIMTHGLGRNKDEDGLFVKVADALAGKDYAVLRYDCAGCGESRGRSEDVTRKSLAADLEAAIAYTENSFSESKLILIGKSLGAAVSALAYSDKVKAMIFYSPGILFSLRERYSQDAELMKELEEKGYFTRPRFHGEFKIGRALYNEELDWSRYAEKVECPVLIICGDRDNVIPLDRFYDTQKLFRNAEIKIISGADHDFNAPAHREELTGITLDWLARNL